MNLSHASVEWAIHSVSKRSDTDLFPRPVELDVIVAPESKAADAISQIDIAQHNPGAPRRFIVPKDDLSYRSATQLNPLDSVILTAIIHQFGEGIEKRRVPRNEEVVFSYRFGPAPDGALYSSDVTWNNFWSRCHQIAAHHPHALLVDIADFYNQIYHHTIENELAESGFPNQAIQWVLRLLKVVSANVSRGIPVGPHSTHILAEASLTPIDNSLAAHGLIYCRYVDDFVIFADSETAARQRLFQIAETLDKQQRLQLQRAKTRVLTSEELRSLCTRMIEDRPINDLERDLVSIVRKHSGGSPYQTIFLSKLSEDELRLFSEASVRKILDEYLSLAEPNFVRLRWFLRRLAQVGHPAAVAYCIEHFHQLIPALGDLCHYFVAVALAGARVDWPTIGRGLLDAFSSDLIQTNEYFQLSILSLFAREPSLDNLASILPRYKTAPPAIRRELLLAAAAANNGDWLRELKEDVAGMDPWAKRAFLYAARVLPSEERDFFIRSLALNELLERLVGLWARS